MSSAGVRHAELPSDPLLQFAGRVPFGAIPELASRGESVPEKEAGYPVAAIGQDHAGAGFLRLALDFSDKPGADALPAEAVSLKRSVGRAGESFLYAQISLPLPEPSSK